MSARLVVVEGPDVGAEFVIPERGGGIGRGEGSFARLSDLSVSRAHCTIEVKDGAFVLIDSRPKSSTRVNGKLVAEHVLADGDEIGIGTTRLAFLPGSARSPKLAAAGRSRVTIEIADEDIFGARSLTQSQGQPREKRHLGALARLGDGLRAAQDREAVSKLVCDAVQTALGTTRALLYLRDATGSIAPAGATIVEDDPMGDRLPVAQDVVDKVMVEKKALVVDASDGDRAALAAPIARGEGGTVAEGLLYADRAREGHGWGDTDLELVACVAHLAGAALDGIAARDALARENRSLEERLGTSREIIGVSAGAKAIHAITAKLGRTDTTVLILGESGAGKELVASAIHSASKRAKGPFVCVNCAALTESVLESELFGHEKGAFTGAVERKIGRFEMADGGTLFLDEVGEISPKCQAKFLRVLEERRFERVGGTRSIAVDVRVIAATNRDLEAMMKSGEFREDLFFRLSVIRVPVPPLRERAEDVPLIAESLLARLRFQTGRRVSSIAPDAAAILRAYWWPGNVRELRNAIEHALVLGEGETIRAIDLPEHIRAAALRGRGDQAAARPQPAGAPPLAVAAASEIPVATTAPAKSLRELEREGIVAALAATRGNKVQAAALLEIDRSTLYKKLKEYGIGE